MRVNLDKGDQLESSNDRYKDENEELQCKVLGLELEIGKLRQENAALKKDNNQLRKEIDWLQLNNDMLTDDPVAHKRAMDEVIALRAENAMLRNALQRVKSVVRAKTTSFDTDLIIDTALGNETQP